MIYCVTDLDGYLIRLDFDHDGELENKISAPAPDWSPLFKPKWDGTQWIETGKAPEPQPHTPSETEMLHAQIKASNDYMDFLEEVIVEMAQMVYE